MRRVVADAESRLQRREIVRGEDKRQARLQDMHVGPTLSLVNVYSLEGIAERLVTQIRSDSAGKVHELEGHRWEVVG